MGTPRERGSGTSHYLSSGWSPVPPRNHDHYSTMLCWAYFIITLLKEVHCTNISSTTAATAMHWCACICSCSNLMLITQLKAS